ncbi:MAG: DUF3306 domain-containing protein [Variovorax sp.]
MANEGFVSRWSRRKVEAKEGEPVDETPVVPEPTAAPQLQAAEPEPAPPPPTIEDARSLTFDSDFRRFIAPDVAPEVKNAAVKKLFADPRFNVRDAMDVYADDYSQADPLPESMLRQMASAQFLKLFETDALTAENADDAVRQTVAQSGKAPEAVPEPPHADPDLRLQQDDAPAGEDAGHGIEPGPSAAHDAVPPRGGSVPEGDQG